jgi:hypothetical protein
MYAYLITGCFWRIACSLHVNINMQKLPIRRRMVVGFSVYNSLCNRMDKFTKLFIVITEALAE